MIEKLKMIEKLSWIRISVSLAASGFALWSMAQVLGCQPDKETVAWIIIVWSLGPPIWFVVENWLVKAPVLADIKSAKDELDAAEDTKAEDKLADAKAKLAKHESNLTKLTAELKTGQELAGKFWAAIAAALFAIYKL